jgi:signal recognition particle receptor subunit beta
MQINWQQRELQLKIVYYGPALSGKTTNLEQIYAKVDPGHRSELISLKTHEDRTLYFDYLQLELGKIGNLTPKILLYTVPGQVYYEASRKLVLRGTDGIVFVADSQPNRMDANRESWQMMHEHLASFDTPLTSIPIVVQFNKQDLPNALSETVLKVLLHMNGLPVYSAVAVQGIGVFDTLKAITRKVVTQVQRVMAR